MGEEEPYFICAVCEKKIQSEPPIVLSVAGVTNEFCGFRCFYRHLIKVYDVAVIRDYTLLHELKE